MSSSLTPEIPIEDFLAKFDSVEKAAKALGLKSRQTIYDWRWAGCEIVPEPWCWKAKFLMEET